MNYKLTIVLLVVLTLVASTSIFAQQAVEITDEPIPLGEKPEMPKVAPHPAGNPFFGMPTLYAEGPLNEGFEGGAIPADWAVYDEDGDGYPWTVYSYYPHTGSYHVKTRWHSYGYNDDWLVTPKLTVAAGDSVSYWARAYSSIYLEEWEVWVSSTGNTPSDLLSGTKVGDESTISTTYGYYAHDLTAFAGQDVWVAFRCVSYDAFYLFLDDISGPDLWVPTGPVAAFNTTDLAFGKVGLDGSPRDLPLIIYSAGTTNLTVSGVSSDNAHFTHDFPGSTVIPPGDSLVVTVSFMPTAETDETGTLTVTHDGTKAESYISLSGSGVPGLLFEDFEATFLPPGWAQYQLGDANDGWVWASGGAPDFTGYAAGHFDEFANCDDWLVTPPITIPAGKYDAMLEFWQYDAYSSYMVYHGIHVSTGSGDPNDGDFVEVASLAAGTDYEWNMAPSIDLMGYAGQTIYIAFVYQGYYADVWGLDDVYVGEYVNQPPEIVHDPKGDTDDTTPTLTAIITDVEPVTATAYYETPSKAFVAMAMTPTGVLPDEYSVDLPAMPYGTVDYYIEADDGIGGVATTDIYSFEIQEFVGLENIYDDGTLESAWTFNELDSLLAGRWAVRFTPLAYPCTLTAAKVGVYKEGWPDDAHQPFAVEVYDDDGAGGEPGTMIYGPDTTGSIGNVVGGLGPLAPPLWAYACISPPVVITEGDFYIAVGAVTLFPESEGWDVDEDGLIYGRSWVYSPDGLWYLFEDYLGEESNLMIRAYTKQVLAYGDLEGTVSEAKGNVEGCLVTAAGALETRSDTTDASGYYFFDDLTCGFYDVSVCMPGYDPQTATDCEVVKDETTTQDFVLFSCGALLCEGFEGDFPPCQWAAYELGDPAGWQQDDYRFYSGNFSAFHNDDNVDVGCDDWLVSPPIAIPPLKGAQLEFMQYQNYAGWLEYHGIHASAGSGDPNDGDFVEVVSLPAGTEDTWEAVGPIDLSAFAGQTIYLAFVYQGDFADEWWIDDVWVMKAPFYLSDGGVDPAIGNLCTSFTYSVTYTHEEDLAPTVQDVYIDGVAYAMTDPTGGAGPYTDGVVFTYEHQFASTGNHEFFFYFKDGTYAVKYPMSGALSGPTNGWYFYDFEDAAHLTSTGPNDWWQWGTPAFVDGPASAHSGDNCWGINLTGDYDYYTASRLMTPHMDFTTGGDDKLELKFWHWYDTEFSYDGGNVKLFTPSDTVVIYPDILQCPDYDDDEIYSLNAWIPYEPGYSGHDQKRWEEAIFDLTPWVGESDVVIAFDFGSNGSVQYPGWYIDDLVVFGDPPLGLPVVLDIKPQSCPNPLNIPRKGVVPVAILGTEDFDVTTVDPSTCLLEGVPPVMWDLADVSTPLYPREDVCDCHELGADGFMDLTLKYNGPAVAAALDSVVDREMRVLTLRGLLTDGCTPIQGQDCVRIQVRKLDTNKKHQFADGGFDEIVVDQGPNPFNLVTEITFSLPEQTKVSLVIYNVLGQKVRTLVHEVMDAGTHSVLWNSTNDQGSLMASGIYFFRFETEKFAKTTKMVLIK